MPDKEGSDDEKKSTKSVVNKKQKLGEEGYDIARDMGKVRPSKDKKDATTMPVSKEMRKTQKVNKGPSAFERVKAKYGKSVMNVGKKKANEELDLTQVAEAFGGYIVEKSEIRKIKGKTYIYPTPGEETKAKELVKKFKQKGDESKRDDKKPVDKPPKDIEDFIASQDPFNPEKGAAKAKETAKKEIETDVDDDPRYEKERQEREGQFSAGPTGQKFKEPAKPTEKKGSKPPIGTKLTPITTGGKVKTTFDPSVIDPKFQKKKPISSDEIRAAKAFKKDLKGETPLPGETEVGKSELKRTASAKIEKPQKETKKPRSATKASPRELRQIQKDIEKSKLDPKRLGQPVVPSPVPTMGKDGKMKNRPLPAFGSQMSDYFKQSPAGQAKIKGIDVDTGKKFDMTNPKDYDKYMKVIGSSKRAKDSAKFRNQNQNQDSAITRTGGITQVGTPTKGGSIVSKAAKDYTKFVKANPVLGGISGLAAYDLGKGVLSKIMNLRGPSVKGGKAGFRSAGGYQAT